MMTEHPVAPAEAEAIAGLTPRLAVLGSPISHSKSPAMHGAAYRELGLEWRYEAIEMTGEGLSAFLDGRGAEWRGLSLTMPVKRDVLPLLDERDELVRLTGVANTLLFEGGRRHGFNTDVYGVVEAFREAGVDSVRHALVLGGGATAASSIVAAVQLGAERISVAVRSPEKSHGLIELGDQLGVPVEVGPLGLPPEGRPDAVISTLPNGTDAPPRFDDALCREAVLFDVAYEPWPSTLAGCWLAAGGRVISGLEMLLHQAVMQVRIFTGGDPERQLPDEERVVAAMRGSVFGVAG